ncbi:sensor histidine kinase [Fibrella rubiginis]|nr:histidine kinase [Fibrella rubiginis]
MSSLQNDSGIVMPFQRPVTWGRIVCHIVYWGIMFAVTYSQFVRAFQDKPNSTLLHIVNTHQFLTTVLSFAALGYCAMPYVLYESVPTWKRGVRLIGVLLLYYGCLCINTYVLLSYAQTHFTALPMYLERRVELFMTAPWYAYLFNPVILFFIYGQFISYVISPLLIKAVRDGYARNQARLAIEQERRRLEVDNLALEKENVMKDLLFLRQQINPHFLLNAFNNIYALIYRKDNRAADTLANLSTLMRYTLYRTGQDFVPLTDELEFIYGYIDMERIRHNKPGVITCQLPAIEPEMANWKIPPLLLVTFIENAFKHGLNAVYSDGWVRIALTTELNESGWLTLTVVNNRTDTPKQTTPDGGIGLQNVKRRLALLFPQHTYELVLAEQPDQFAVRLAIPLKGNKDTTMYHDKAHTMSSC